MEQRQFNLLDEPWIRVVTADCATREVSLVEALLEAHKFSDLSGEMAAQDAAILRLLLAVLHTVFSRVDADGSPAPLERPVDALKRWKRLRDGGRFPEAPIRAYLNQWHDRFYLFHPERPFYQATGAASGTEYRASKLNGEISESANKLKLFSSRAGGAKSELSYAEAARWLLYLNAFDDNSSKPKQKGLPAPGAGWLGKVGLLEIVGKNLFETLLMNLTLLRDGDRLWPEAETPVWELERPRNDERVEIPMPQNCAGLLTLQSRRILLQRKGERVTGYTLLGGDFFEKEDAFSEQMTIWRRSEDKKTKQIVFVPQRHDRARQIWREFEAIAVAESSARIPGVVRWVQLLQRKGLLERSEIIRLRTAAVQYGSSDYMAEDSYSDSLSLHSNLLGDAGAGWMQRIMDQIGKIDELAKACSRFSVDLSKAAGRNEKDFEPLRSAARQRWYGQIDLPFRAWLEGLSAEQDADEMDRLQLEWQAQARRMALSMADAAIREAGDAAFVGRTIEDKKSGKKERYASPEIYRRFKNDVYRIYPNGQTHSEAEEGAEKYAE